MNVAGLRRRLTGTVSELEAKVGTSEAIDGDGQLHHLAPARAVVVVQNKRAIFTVVGLPAAQTDAVLRREGARRVILGDVHSTCGRTSFPHRNSWTDGMNH